MLSSFVIKPKASLYLFFLFCITYIAGFTLFLFAHLALWMHLLLAFLLLLHCVYVMRRHVFYLHSMSVTRLWCNQEKEWMLQCHDARIHSVKLLQSVVVSRYFIFLAFRISGRRRWLPVSLAIDSDALDNMRSLRRLLQEI